jgi:predicted Zn-dependent protease
MWRVRPAAIGGVLWAVWVAWLAIGGISPEARAEARVATRAHEAVRPPLVVVRGVGAFSAEPLRRACRTLLEAYPVRCEIRANRSISEVASAWNPERAQMDARRFLDRAFATRTDEALVELDITTLDIYEQTKPYVFGLASLSDRVAVVSVARLIDDPEHLQRRMHKLVLHETAHALGLRHHDAWHCVMRQDPTPSSLDDAPSRLCRKCHRQLVRATIDLSRSGQVSLDRARGHLARGEVQLAREALVRTLWALDYDVALLNDFGEAFLDAGQANEAISVYRYSLQLSPTAEAHARIGIAFRLRGQPGDRDHALGHFRAALKLRPDWALVAHHLQSLEAHLPSAQGP